MPTQRFPRQEGLSTIKSSRYRRFPIPDVSTGGGGGANIFQSAAVGIALSQLFEQSGTEVDVGVSVAQGPITLTDEQTPGFTLSHYAVGDTPSELEAGLELSQVLTLEGVSAEQVPAFEVLREALILVRLSGGSGVTEEAVAARTDWANDVNATGKHNGVSATIAGNATGARGGRLVLDYAAFTNKHLLIIDSVELHFYTNQAGTIANNGDLKHQWRRATGGAWITLATFTGNQDSMTVPATYDITASIGSWADLEALQSGVSFESAIAELQTAACDAVEIEINAHLLFDPADVPGLASWYRADAVGVALADAAAVATWDNAQGTAARDVAQATGANQPTIRLNVQNGKPAVRFDGGDFLTNATAFLAGASGSVFAVAKSNASAVLRTIIASSDIASTTRLGQMYISAGDGLGVLMRDPTVVNVIQTAAASVADTAWHILEMHSDGASYELVIDGTVVAGGVVAGADDGKWWSFVPARDNTTIGARTTTSTGDFWNGDIAEVIAYDAVTLTTEQKDHIREWYLQDKYGL